ncbi:hypothetical protein BH10ACT6_BH10ACT6_14540 [soil metagenome]
MTDSTPTPSTPEPVVPPAAPAAPAAPAYAPASGPKQTTSLVGFILGLVAFVFSWIGIIGIGAGIAAIIVSRRAKRSEPTAPSWMPLVGTIGGIIGIVLGVIFGIIAVLSILLPLLIAGSYNNY